MIVFLIISVFALTTNTTEDSNVTSDISSDTMSPSITSEIMDITDAPTTDTFENSTSITTDESTIDEYFTDIELESETIVNNDFLTNVYTVEEAETNTVSESAVSLTITTNIEITTEISISVIEEKPESDVEITTESRVSGTEEKLESDVEITTESRVSGTKVQPKFAPDKKLEINLPDQVQNSSEAETDRIDPLESKAQFVPNETIEDVIIPANDSELITSSVKQDSVTNNLEESRQIERNDSAIYGGIAAAIAGVGVVAGLIGITFLRRRAKPRKTLDYPPAPNMFSNLAHPPSIPRAQKPISLQINDEPTTAKIENQISLSNSSLSKDHQDIISTNSLAKAAMMKAIKEKSHYSIQTISTYDHRESSTLENYDFTEDESVFSDP
jgi:hypothetical protein